MLVFPLNKEIPLLIAEIGGNHEGNFDYALQLVDLALTTPVDYVKFQIYTGDTLVSSVEDPARNAHFKKFELSREQHEAIIAKIKGAGKKYLASVWDTEAIVWIDPFVDSYKVGSGDLTAYPLLKRICASGKPIIVSTGLASLAEVEAAVAYIRTCNSRYCEAGQLCLLQCTSMYPIADADAHLQVMNTYRQHFDCQVGYSDHTTGMKALELAAVMGADVLEFHFTDAREGKSFRDHAVSLTAAEVRDLRALIESNSSILGHAFKNPLSIEIENGHLRSFRRAVYPSRDIAAGEGLSEENLTILRPNEGIDAREFDQLLDKKAKYPLKRHQVLRWEDIQ